MNDVRFNALIVAFRRGAGLEVLPRHVTFLGFPDEGLCPLATSYLSARGKSYESPFTDRTMPPRETVVAMCPMVLCEQAWVSPVRFLSWMIGCHGSKVS